MRWRKTGTVGAGLMLAGVLALSACGSSDDGASKDATSSGGQSAPIGIVASTNVWGDVAKQVGGDAVEVTSIISDPDQDPHSYEADANTALAISKASIVIENGGGYDDFVDQLLDANSSDATVLNAVDISGKTAPADGELNEHVWYDFPTVQKVADEIAAELGKADPDDAATFTSNASAFKDKVDGLISETDDLKSSHAGEGVGITEPVPLYLTEAAGLVNKTPEAFSEAIEEGEDVSAATLKETLDLYTNHEVKVLVYNEQTSGPITEQIEKAAKKAGIPVVPVTETLPSGLDYVGWMQQNIDALRSALG
ncbi:MAG: zinc ABC transporter substrate-binding protein [Nocardioides sp.]|uniref:metal ABC transporter solute-binding protein, Zn/Mn family n=1 Tax=Nocardioides sp. TaxID=35761 RepID=UPI0039E66A6D